jgi:hypothetical protein
MDMRVLVLTLLLVGCLLLDPLTADATMAQATCDWYPSSACPARGVTRGMAHYPCLNGQIKADWNTMLYRDRLQDSYGSAGFEVNADIWCFDDEFQAREYGFRHAAY